jgi:hypothetical protein
MTQFLGKYRGKAGPITLDPENRGRIQVNVPLVMGANFGWAMPCVPYAGIQAGFYAVPPPGANVWVEFEGGHPDRPIWTGCFWETAETPSMALAPPQPVQHILLQTTQQNVIHVCDGPPPLGGILLKTASNAMIQINDLGITISNGKGAMITLMGKTVDINQMALTII